MTTRTTSPSPTPSDTFTHLRNLVLEIFPKAEEYEAYSMKGWRIERRVPPPPKPWTGTIDPRYVIILPAFRKAGLTIHLTNPADYLFLDKPRAQLEKSGWGVMRGCLTWKRKGEPAWDGLSALLRDVRDSAST
jgi:hypothetical protein